MVSGFQKTRAYSQRHYVIVMAFAVVLAVGALGWYFSTQTTIVWEKDVTNQEVKASNQFARSNPVLLEIPALNIQTSFVPPLVLQSDQTVSVPDSYTEVGWYSGGATPGEVGPAVILGHVDSKDGPAIFYPLGQLREGDDIVVTRADGTVATFTVTKLQRYPQSNFPTQDVYGPTNEAVLRLVTCTGTFNRGEQKYSHNLVVFAKLKE